MTPLTSSTAAGSTSRFAEAHATRGPRRAERDDDDHPKRRASKCDDGDACEGPRRSPLVKALVQALREVLAAPTSTTAAADGASTDAAKAAKSAKSSTGAVSTAEAKAAKAAAKSTDAAAGAEPAKTDTPATEAAADVEKAAAATDGDALERALTAFASALMQALRGGDEGRHGHHRGHGHHFGRREGMGWSDDPAQRLDKLASMVAQAALGTAPAKPATTSAASTSGSTAGSTGAATAAATSTAAATETAASDEAQAATSAEATAAPAPAPATLVLEIRLVPGVSSASPWARAADDLVSAFGSLQQALGRSTAAEGSEGSVRDQLATFLRDLASRLRGDEQAMSDVEPTRPGSLIDVKA